MDFLILRGARFRGHNLLASTWPITELQPSSLRHSGFRALVSGETGAFFDEEIEELTNDWPFCSEGHDGWFSFARKGEAGQLEAKAIGDRLYFRCTVPVTVKSLSPISVKPYFSGDHNILGEINAVSRFDCDVELRIVVERNPALRPSEGDDDYCLFGEGWEEAWE